MESHAKVAGHAAHQMLIVFPLGLLTTAVVFDLLQRLTDNESLGTASYYMVVAGVLTGVLAAAAGVVDYLAVPPGTRAKRVGRAHGIGNGVVLLLFGLSWLLRVDEPQHVATTLALALAVAGAVLSGLTGWLGGELVDRLGVGVDPDAHLDAETRLTTGIRLGRGSAEPTVAPRS